MKRFVVFTATILFVALAVLTSMSFRWYSVRKGYQENQCVETQVSYKRAATPIPNVTYYMSDRYRVSYNRGRFPFVKKEVVHLDRKLIYYKD